MRSGVTVMRRRNSSLAAMNASIAGSREIDVLFDGVLRSRYRVARIEGRVSNGWLDCPDFMIERIPPAQDAVEQHVDLAQALKDDEGIDVIDLDVGAAQGLHLGEPGVEIGDDAPTAGSTVRTS
jgi:hypothetical protein